jgi:hypothetical protein
MEENLINIIFVREYKHYIAALGKKSKDDYVLNVNKIIKDKFKIKFIVPNKVQSFLLNYEIKKLLDKAITLKNRKYKKVIYLNSNLSYSTILNTIDFIEEEYDTFTFQYSLIESKKSEEDEISKIEKLNRIKV